MLEAVLWLRSLFIIYGNAEVSVTQSRKDISMRRVSSYCIFFNSWPVTKPNRMRLVGHVTHVREKRHICATFK
jgi:hypothetical protein